MAKNRRFMPQAIVGEVGPKLYGRLDQEFWESAAKKMQNFVPFGQGLAQSRPGTIYVGETGGWSTEVTDDFEDGVIDTNKWIEIDPDSGLSESGGYLQFAWPSTSASYLRSVGTYDTTGNNIYRMRVKVKLPYCTSSPTYLTHFGIGETNVKGMLVTARHFDPSLGSIGQYVFSIINSTYDTTGFEVKTPYSSSFGHLPWYWFEIIISGSKRALRIRSDDDINCHEWRTLYEDSTGYSSNALKAWLWQGVQAGNAAISYVDECTVSLLGSGKARLIPFVVSESTSYILELTDGLMRFYHDSSGPTQITSGGDPVEVLTPWSTSDLDEIQYDQVGDILYLTHKDHAPMKLIRGGDADWTLTPLTLYPSPVAEIKDNNADYANVTLTLAAVAGRSIKVTASAASFAVGDEGRVIESGVGRAVIIGVVSTTVVIVNIIDPFSSTSLAVSTWTLYGTPLAALTASATGMKSGFIRLECVTDEEQWTAITESTDRWVASGSGTNEYYLQNTAAGYTAVEPVNVYEEGAAMTVGTMGSLAIGEWDWGDNDTLGYNTIYVRLSGVTADPDSLWDNNPTYLMRAAAAGGAPFRAGFDEGRYIVYATGMVKITRVHSTTLVTGEVVEPLAATTASYLWLLEDNMWTPTLGYPGAIAFHQNRLCMGGSDSFKETVCASYADDYENFIFGTDDADAMKITMPGAKVRALKWLMSSNNALLVGAEGAEFAVTSSGAYLTPADRNPNKQTENGSADVQPVNADGSIIMVQRKGRTVRELGYDFATSNYRSPVRTFLADHITDSGVVAMAHQTEPCNTTWMVLGNGTLIGLTFFREQGIVAWHKHSFTSGTVESIAVIPHPTEDYDQVWLSIKRTISGTDKRYIEVFNPFFDSTSLTDNKQLDSQIEYSGVATSTLSGLGHLEGLSVSVINSSTGEYLGDYTVSSGAIDISADGTVTDAVIGLKYTCTYQKLPIRSNAGVGKRQSIDKVRVLFYQTQGGKVGPSETASELEPVEWSDTTTVQTGWAEVDVNGGKKDADEGGCLVTIIQDEPLPMSISAIEPEGDF